MSLRFGLALLQRVLHREQESNGYSREDFHQVNEQ